MPTTGSPRIKYFDAKVLHISFTHLVYFQSPAFSEGWNFFYFLFTQCLEYCPAYNKSSVNDCWLAGWTDGWMHGGMDAWTDGWMTGWMDE